MNKEADRAYLLGKDQEFIEAYLQMITPDKIQSNLKREMKWMAVIEYVLKRP